MKVYTVFNVGPEIYVPSGPDPNLAENKSYRDLLRPQSVFRQVPEAPFILRRPAPTDPLLWLLFLSDDLLKPSLFAKGRGMAAEMRDTWSRLGRALTHVANNSP